MTFHTYHASTASKHRMPVIHKKKNNNRYPMSHLCYALQLKRKSSWILTIQSEELLAKMWTMCVVRPPYLRALPAQLIALLPSEPNATHDVVGCWLGGGHSPGRKKTFPMESTAQTLCSVTATWTSFDLPAYTIHNISQELLLVKY